VSQSWSVKGTVRYISLADEQETQSFIYRNLEAEGASEAQEMALGLFQALMVAKGTPIREPSWDSEPQVTPFDPVQDR
jgi:hypothetical protein